MASIAACLSCLPTLKHELLIRPIGNTVYLMPPYIIGDDDIELLAARLAAVLKEVIPS